MMNITNCVHWYEFFAFMNWSEHKITNRIAVVPRCVKLLSESIKCLCVLEHNVIQEDKVKKISSTDIQLRLKD